MARPNSATGGPVAAVDFRYGDISSSVALPPYVGNGPIDQRGFHETLVALQEHINPIIPWATYQRRLSLVASADTKTSQFLLESPRSTSKSWNSNYGTHGWHRYVGRFPPHVVRAILNHFEATGDDVVLDPFSGSGTTLVECRLLGIPAIGVEISPLSALMSRVKSQFPDAATTLTTVRSQLEAFYSERWTEVTRGRTPSTIDHKDILARPGNLVEPFANYERWLTPEALLGVSIVVEFAAGLSGYSRDAVVLALSSKMRSIGNVDVDVVRAEYSKQPRINVDVLKLVCSQLTKMAMTIEASIRTHLGFIGEPQTIKVIEGDVREVSIPDGSVSHVITSPPYGVEAISYLRTHLLSFRCLKVFLEADPYAFGKNVIGSEYISDDVQDVDAFEVAHLSSTYRSFFQSLNSKTEKKLRVRTMMMMSLFEDMRLVTERLSRWVRPEGQMAFVIGNNKIGDTVIPTDVIMKEIFDALGFASERSLRHKLKSNNSNSQVPWQDRIIQDEFILFLRRRATR